jgi:hypothetical protein
VTLRITDRFAGDNYRVRATCRFAAGSAQPFDESSGVTSPAQAVLRLPGVDIGESMLLTAWKRIYYEMDTMYRRGSWVATPTVPAPVGIVRVADRTQFAVGDTVRVFDQLTTDGAATVRRIVPPGPPAPGQTTVGTLFLTVPLGNRYGVMRPAYVGVESPGPPDPFFVPDTSMLEATFDDVFVEWRQIGQRRLPGVPREDEPPLNIDLFTDDWFDNRPGTGRNTVHLVGAGFSTLNDGLTSPTSNCSYVFVQRAPGVVHIPAKIRDIINHELTHQFTTWARASADGDHDLLRAWDNADNCLMDDATPRNGAPGSGRNDVNDTHELCIDHLYVVRDNPDGL